MPQLLFHQARMAASSTTLTQLSVHSVQLGPFRNEFPSLANPPALNPGEISRPLSASNRSRLSYCHAHSNQIHLFRLILMKPSRELLKLCEQQSAVVHGAIRVRAQRRAVDVKP
jgi:hypothetical protein